MGVCTSFQDLIVWQKSHELVLDIYKITRNFPDEEKFGLISQMRRSAISIPANIAEAENEELLRKIDVIGKLLYKFVGATSK
ncbi:MAG: four helix bundle protein [Nitrospirota bacterium]